MDRDNRNPIHNPQFHSRQRSDRCTILTTGPNSLVADLHDRMPVIVTPDKYDVWLDPDVKDFETIRDILKPYDANLMRRYPDRKSTRLNSSHLVISYAVFCLK